MPKSQEEKEELLKKIVTDAKTEDEAKAKPEDEDADDDEDDETDSQTDETEDEDEENEDDPPKSNVQKRIDSLTAKVKTQEKTIQELEDKLSDDKEEVEERTERLERKKAALLKSLPEWNYGGKPIYELNEKQFNQMKREYMQRTDVSAEDKVKTMLSVTAAREKFLEEVEPLVRDEQALAQRSYNIWLEEWGQVEKMLVDKETGDPELKKHLKVLSAQLLEDIKDEYTYEKLKKGGLKEKIKYSLKLIKRLGIDHSIETALYRNERPEPDVSVSKGKGPKSGKSGGIKKYTAKEIQNMSDEEYAKNRESILAAMKGKKLK